ncbi:hypothetical protein GCM10009638_12490 [Luteococcus sanguinis]
MPRAQVQDSYRDTAVFPLRNRKDMGTVSVMENNDSYDPAAALDDARLAREQVAARASAPAYYYPALGAAVAVCIAGEAAGGPLAALGVILLAVTSGLLISRYREATGLWVTYGSAGRRSRRVWLGYGMALLALLAAAVWVQLTGRPAWWGAPLGLLGLAVTLAVGRIMEPRLREELRTGSTVMGRK